MRNVLDKVIEKMNTHILCLISFSENRAIYEIMSKNVVTLRLIGESLLPWKSNKHYILVCVCMFVRACVRACVHVVTRTRGRAHSHTWI